MTPIRVEEIEQLLDEGNLFGAMTHGKWWRFRRNGKTQRWKRDPSRFRIPVKAGLYVYSTITEDDIYDGTLSINEWRREADAIGENHGEVFQ